MLIDGRTSGLNDVDIGAAHALLDFNVQLGVRKTLQQYFNTVDTQSTSNTLG
jgi:hypothetical protein